ncbi:MAG TPA: type I polyketide synthase, partial [Ktedonobacteraceae bacterium]|nr:type I polyketide synthase [Ktedonobacteraceae bacterium]
MIDANTFNDAEGTDVAIIGLAGRFPGAHNVDQFWQNLCAGVESITRFSDEELLNAGIDPALLNDPNYVKAGAIIDDIDLFDAVFFGLTPKEAQIMDPQHRLFIETAWHALENAGYDPEAYQKSIGLYAGTAISTYLLNNIYPNSEVVETVGTIQAALGNDKDSLTTRVAYLLNLTGPCYSVQTYCSTSLVAVSIACSSLLNGECDMALAGGVALSVPQRAGYYYQEGGIASPDARCRAFDAEANGAPLGNGVGIVVLKRLEDALHDGDYIYAVIKGSAINNDGSIKAGFTAPGVKGQSGVVLEALANADIEADSIDYVEAHGTGTPLGDAVELAALIKAFRKSTDRKQFCALGSVKTNVGHLDRAAGVTGLIKTSLSLKHKLIPPSLNFRAPNTQVDLENSPFYVNTQLSEWKSNGKPRRAGVSAFGLGGTNAHVIVDEAPVIASAPSQRSRHLLLLSAKSEAALDAATENLRTHLQEHPDLNLADVAYTLQVGRRAFAHRRMFVCSSMKDAQRTLNASDALALTGHELKNMDRPIAWMFAGVGEQYVGMGRDLYEQEAVFRQTVDQCCELALQHGWLSRDLRPLLYPAQSLTQDRGGGLDLAAMLGRSPSASSAEQALLQQTEYAQPAVFIIEYALAQLLLSWGLRPQALIGYSLGEYVAACVAGTLSLSDALRLVCRRAQLIAALPTGSMLAVALSPEQVQSWLSDQISLAIINSAKQCVLAGTPEAIAALQTRLGQEEIVSRLIPSSHAFHSPLLVPAQAELDALAASITMQPPQIPYLSNVTGEWISEQELHDPQYWSKHLCQTVHFASGMQHLWQQGQPVFVEIGPGQSL